MLPSLNDIRQLKRREILTCFVMFFSIIAPGVLLLCLWDMPLVLAVTTPKLVLLASAITLPLAALNTVFGAISSSKEEQNDHLLQFLLGSIHASFAFYVVLIFKFFLPLSGTFFVSLLLALNFTFLLVAMIQNRSEFRKTAKSGESKDAEENPEPKKS